MWPISNEIVHETFVFHQTAIASPSNTTASFARRLINESPAPQLLTPSERPKLSRPPVMDLNESFDLFDSSPKESRSSSAASAHSSQPTATAKRKLSGNESKPKLIKISSAADVRTSEVTDISNVADMMHLNILKKKSSFMANTSSVFRQGFNGLGGREKHITPLPRLPSISTSSSFKMPKTSKNRQGSSLASFAKAPRLPSLIDVDDSDS